MEAVVVDKKKEKIKDIMSYIRKYSGKDTDGQKSVVDFASNLDLELRYIKPPMAALQKLLGRDGVMGGFPCGKYTIIAGPEKVGKSSLMLQTIAYDMTVEPDGIWAWVDAENAIDIPYATSLGIDMSRLVIIKVSTMEEQLQRIIDLTGMKVLRGVVVDSVGALTPRAEVKDSKGKEHDLEHTGMLDLQKKLGQFFRMSNGSVDEAKTAVILIAHVYQDINSYGAPFVVKGGNALKHWGNVRLMMSRSKDAAAVDKIVMPDGSVENTAIGHDVKIRLDKTRQNSHEGQFVVMPFRYGIGFDCIESAINVGVNLGVIKRTGPMYTFNENKIKGRENVSEYFKSNPKAYEELTTQIQNAKPEPVKQTEVEEESELE